MSSDNALVLRPAQNEDDDWRTVEDKKLRKKIQDRLAQRARRRRIAESKQKQKESSATPEQVSSPTQVEMELVAATAPADQFSTAEYHLLPRRFMSALQALFNNGVVLGMPATRSCSSGISQANPTAPESLRPTNLQLSLLHYNTIDKFPFPVFRNNLILMQDNIDPQEFLYDIINMHSFWVVDGRPPWDQSAWRMGKDYEKKWGYLFSLGEGETEDKSASPVFTAAPSLSYVIPTTTAC